MVRAVMLKAAEQVRTRVWRDNVGYPPDYAYSAQQALGRVCAKPRDDVYSAVHRRVWDSTVCIFIALVGWNWLIDAARVDAVLREPERKENE